MTSKKKGIKISYRAQGSLLVYSLSLEFIVVTT
jgi:hypothetical protein